jgi:hypothetical protein
MIQYGKNITTANDPLKNLTVEKLYRAMQHPSPEHKSKVHQLRTVLTIDEKKYRKLKTSLPYITCGIFNPPYRKSSNFASIQYFILDIDHLKAKGMTALELKDKLKKDERIRLMFISPGNDGLKILFSLSDKCFDRQKFSMFYRIFAHRFSEQYGLQQVIDTSTSDVTRACFVSVDEQVYYNPSSAPVFMQSIIDFEQVDQVDQAKEELKELDKKAREGENDKNTGNKKELAPDVLEQIKMKLNPNIKTKKEKQYFVPEEVKKITDTIREKVAAYDIETMEIKNISFGRKFVFSLQDKWAEVNVFYGKRGYSAVKTPKNESDPELADITHKIICEFLFG